MMLIPMIRLHHTFQLFLKTGRLKRTLLCIFPLCTLILPLKSIALQYSDFSYTTNRSPAFATITGYSGVGGLVVIPDNISGVPVQVIGDNAFRSVTTISSIIISSNVTYIGNYAFYGCTSLTNTALSNVNDIGYLAFFNCNSLPYVLIPNSVTNMGDQVFASCTSLTNAILGNNVARIGIASFHYCTSLSDVTIGSSVTNIENQAFSQCHRLMSVTIPSQVVNIGNGSFNECLMLTNASISSSVTSIGSEVFNYCPQLTAITVHTNNNSYSSEDGVLFNKSKTILIQYPSGREGIYSIPDSVINITDHAFNHCFTLTEVTIPNSVVNIGHEAFSDCTNLHIAVIGDNVTSIPYYTFANCIALTEISIPNSVTSIGYNAFYECRSLTNVVIPNSVTSIGITSFYRCYSLTSIIIPSNVATIGEGAFGDGTVLERVYFLGAPPSLSPNVFIYSDLVTIYYMPSTTNWGSTFGDRPAVLWNPVIGSDGEGLNIGSNGFNFSITGTTNIPIMVEACTNLFSGSWIPLLRSSLTNGSISFGDPDWTNHLSRYYRISAP